MPKLDNVLWKRIRSFFKLARNKKVALVLGGGGARGFAHIGVLKVLDRLGIVPDLVVGTSVGSLIGALYCAGWNWEKIQKRAQSLEWKELVRATIPAKGILHPQGLQDLVETLLEGRGIQDFDIPFRAVAVDLVRGRQVVFDQGSPGLAIRASSGIPGIFVPLENEGRMLVDGGVVNTLPSDVALAAGADYIIAVNLNSDDLDTVPMPRNIVEIMTRSMTLLMNTSTRQGRRLARCLVEPDLRGFPQHDISHGDDMMARGEMAMEKAYRKHRLSLDRLAKRRKAPKN